MIDLRRMILERVHQGATMRAIAREVDEEIRSRGMENCHRKHIGAVLGHRLTLHILAVQDGRAWFLDDDLPHHRRWRAMAPA